MRGRLRPLFILALALGTSATMPTLAQTGVDGASGRSSQLIPGGVFAVANFTDTSLKLSFSHRQSDQEFGWGLDVKGTSVNGFTTLEAGGAFSGQVSGSFFGAWQKDYSDPKSLLAYQKVAVGPQYTRASYPVSPKVVPGSVDIETYNGFGLQAIYNAYFIPGKGQGVTFLLGTAATAGRTNNYSDLPKGSACTIVASSTASSPQVEQCKDVRIGAYETSVGVGLDSSVTVFPGTGILGGQFGLLVDIGYDTTKSERWTPGIGLTFAQPSGVKTPIGALTFQRRNGSWALGLQAGVPFK
jgi:hypothetical protein